MDQTQEVIDFVRDRHPELSVDDIVKCIESFSEWVALEMKKEYQT
jgi:hypothetical protein